MKYLLLIAIIFGGILSRTTAQITTATKRALVFAIGNYPPKFGWDKISSIKDVELIKTTLLRQGFLNQNIQLVTDKLATIAGIKNAFTSMINKAAYGDIVVIHFSSHGEQVESDNTTSVDGMDECIVSYDAIAPDAIKGIAYEKLVAGYLRGHVIGEYLYQLRKKLGKAGDLVIFMDCCHSGGNTRGVKKGKVRGGRAPIVSPTFNPASHRGSDSSFIAREENHSRGNANGIQAGETLSSIEVISATRPEELDLEASDGKGGWVGSLSMAVSKSFQK